MVFTRNGRIREDGSFDWAEAIADAIITGGVTFFNALMAAALTGPLVYPQSLEIPLITAAGAAFTWLAVKRGFAKPVQPTQPTQ